MLYHVSSTPGIKVLEPRVSTHKKAYVYAIENLTTGLLFGIRHDDFDFCISTDENGKPSLYECYPGAFDRVYSGKSCVIYELSEEGFLRGMTGWEPELVSEQPVPVQKETAVPDIKERLLLEEQKGNLTVHKYREDTEYKAFVSRHIVDRLIRFDAIRCIETDVRFQKYYAKLIEGLEHVMDGHLL